MFLLSREKFYYHVPVLLLCNNFTATQWFYYWVMALVLRRWISIMQFLMLLLRHNDFAITNSYTTTLTVLHHNIVSLSSSDFTTTYRDACNVGNTKSTMQNDNTVALFGCSDNLKKTSANFEFLLQESS